MRELAANILKKSKNIIIFGFGFNQYDSSLLELLHENGIAISKVMLIDVVPKTDIAQELWPKADIYTTLPPPEGSKNIRLWLEDNC